MARSVRDIDDLTSKHSIAYGFAQAMALFRASRARAARSPSAACSATRVRPRRALRSSSPSRPSSARASTSSRKSARATAAPAGPDDIATIVAFVVGFAVIAWLMRYLKTRSYMPFVVYRVALGVFVIVLVTAGAIDPSAGFVPAN